MTLSSSCPCQRKFTGARDHLPTAFTLGRWREMTEQKGWCTSNCGKGPEGFVKRPDGDPGYAKGPRRLEKGPEG